MNLPHPFLDLKAENAPFLDELTRAASRVITSGRYIGGDEVRQFESQLASATQTAHAIGVSNGLDALRLSLRSMVALGMMHPGDEVILPANSFIASLLAVADAGLTPVCADISLSSLLLSAESVDSLITPRTRAIMPVHLYGRVCWDSDLASITAAHSLYIIEDCAQAIGASATIPGLNATLPAGSLGHVAAFSFYPTKNVGALGDAGAVTTSSPDIARMVRTLANYGSTERNHYPYSGFNCRLDPLQAAMLSVKLNHIDEINTRRRLVARTYSTSITNPAVALPPLPAEEAECVWHQYVVRITAGSRDRFRQSLLANGVETDIHYPIPLHKQPCGRDSARTPLPNAETAAQSIVSLPVGAPSTPLSAKEISQIINHTLA